MSKAKESDIKKEIRRYLMDENRPFSANDILNKMHGDCGKSALTKALDMLVNENAVKEKTYGKQKVYFINQDAFEVSNNDMLNMDAQSGLLSNTLNSLHKQIKNLEFTLEDLKKCLTTEVAKGELQSIMGEVAVLQDELNRLESNFCSIDPSVRKALSTKKENVGNEYKCRKRLANNIIDAILEGYPKSKKQLLEDIGLETDDDVNL